MNLKVPLLGVFVLTVGCLIGFSGMAIAISRHEILMFDSYLISVIRVLEYPVLTPIMKFFTMIGNTESVIVLSVIVLLILYLRTKSRSEFILVFLVIIGAPVINRILKEFFQRARPDFHRLIEIGGYSFPSGHAMNAMAFYGIVAFILWRHIPTRIGRTVLILFSGLFIFTIGLSRVYLGVHYPSDIIAGYLASGFWLSLSIWVFQWYKEKLSARNRLSRRKV